ncbi:MAG: hypothetical protein Q9228_007801 [Teloschistes exilis]
MANAASAQALDEGKKRLREFLEESNTGRQAMAMPSDGGIQMGKHEHLEHILNSKSVHLSLPQFPRVVSMEMQ